MAGQINLGTPLGDAIRRLAANRGYHTALEIGTWNGLGSTLCLLRGAADRPAEFPLEIWSIEANQQMAAMVADRLQGWWEAAKKHKVPEGHPYKEVSDAWGKKLPVNCPIRLMYGRMAADMMTIPQILTHPLYPKVEHHYRLHYNDELASIREAPLLGLRRHFDIVILDGGEFSGEQDWAAVQRCNPKVVVLDDTLVIKNSRVLENAMKNGWTVMAEGADRNGWAILKAPGKTE
jgi:hypothetical protein